jgi:hypothetical protein
MKVSEYIPFYGLLFNFEYQTGIEGKPITVNEMFDNYPDFELTDIHIEQLYYFDLASLQTELKNNYFTHETVVSYLRELFDNYRQSGGNPLDWLKATFESINLNPQNYKAELRATLEKTLIEWIEIFNKQPIDYLYYNTNPEALTTQQSETKTDKLKVSQIALIHFYEGLQITRGNAKEIAAKHGYTSKNSGEGLFQDYSYYSSTANRKGKPTHCTPKKLKNKIKLFESVISHLSDNNKQRAIDEIRILKTLFENEYQ